MKKSELFFTALLVPLDFLMLVLAGVSAYFLRFASYFVQMREVRFDLPLQEFLILAFVIIPVWLLIFAINGLYSVKRRRFVDDLYKTITAISTGMAAVFAYLFFTHALFGSRFIVLAVWFLSIIYVMIGRSIIKVIQRWLYKFGFGVHRVVIVGLNPLSRHLIKNFADKFSGFKVIARIKDYNETSAGTLDKLSQKRGIDDMFLVDPNLEKEKILYLIDFADEHKIDFRYAPDLFGTEATNIDVSAVSGIPLVELKRTPLDGWGRILKRIIDVILSIILLILLSPVFLIIAILIKIDSSGNVFVKLKRVSSEGVFEIYKFRSMVKNAHLMKKELLQYSERKGPLFKMKDDPRITRMGRFLRKSRIDELPQLINVLKNDMSLIGPRPHEPEEVEQYKKHQKKVLRIKPGMTGMAQVSGASDLTFNEEVRLDTYYIENWSLLLDLQIFLKTLLVVLEMKGAV